MNKVQKHMDETQKRVLRETKINTDLEHIEKMLSEIKTGQDRLEESIKTIGEQLHE